MSAMDRRVAFAAEVADARRGTAEAIMKLEKHAEGGVVGRVEVPQEQAPEGGATLKHGAGGSVR